MSPRIGASRRTLGDGGFDYVVRFESSGMYNGEDVPWIVSHLLAGRLDAVWGSRRLSVRDIEEAYRLKYRQRALLGAVSRAGSHLLSLAYLVLYGRYVSDTLSGAIAVRTGDVLHAPVGLTHKQANQHLLSGLLRRKAEMFEVPVHFYSLSPAQVRRTTPGDGLRAIATLVWGRLRPARAGDPAAPPRETADPAAPGGQDRPLVAAAAHRRALVIPAAGRGSRLGSQLPKALVPVAGRSMLSWIVDLYRHYVDGVAVVAHPSARHQIRGSPGIHGRPWRRGRTGRAHWHARRGGARLPRRGRLVAQSSLGDVVRSGRRPSCDGGTACRRGARVGADAAAHLAHDPLHSFRSRCRGTHHGGPSAA